MLWSMPPVTTWTVIPSLLFLGRAARPAQLAYIARQPTGVCQRLPEQIFDLCVGAAQVVRRPAGKRVVHHGIQPEQDLLPFGGHGTSGSLIERSGVDHGLGVAAISIGLPLASLTLATAVSWLRILVEISLRWEKGDPGHIQHEGQACDRPAVQVPRGPLDHLRLRHIHHHVHCNRTHLPDPFPLNHCLS
jgi:hypothetical protein